VGVHVCVRGFSMFVCVFLGFIMRECSDNSMGVLVIHVSVFTVFCIVCTVFFVPFFMYIYSYLFCMH
jgi:hypothetical protein